MTPDKSQTAHKLATLVYLLYILGFLFGITAVIGFIINQSKLPATYGTYSHSHFIWQILSFAILFAGVVVTLIWLPNKAAVTACLLWWASSALIGIWFLVKRQPVPFLTSTNQHTKRT